MNALRALKHIFEENALPQPHPQQTMPNRSIVCQHHLLLGMTTKVVLEIVNTTLQMKEKKNKFQVLHYTKYGTDNLAM